MTTYFSLEVSIILTLLGRGYVGKLDADIEASEWGIPYQASFS